MPNNTDDTQKLWPMPLPTRERRDPVTDELAAFNVKVNAFLSKHPKPKSGPKPELPRIAR